MSLQPPTVQELDQALAVTSAMNAGTALLETVCQVVFSLTFQTSSFH